MKEILAEMVRVCRIKYADKMKDVASLKSTSLSE